MNSKLRPSALSQSYSALNCSERIVAVYRGWDAFEQVRGGPSIIDFDLTPLRHKVSFNSREEILLALEELHQEMDGSCGENEFLRDKLAGSMFYLRALMNQSIPFYEYVEHTLGIRPVYFSDEDIESVRSHVDDLLSLFGMRLKKEYKAEFERKLIINDPDAIKEGIVGKQEFWLDQLRRKGIPCPENLKLKIEYVNVDAYWSNWISGSYQQGFVLRINLNSRKKYDVGRPLALCLHEICGHAVQMSVWGKLIWEGKINAACGLTTVHSPETFVAEGLGQSIADFLGEEPEFPREFWLSRWLHYYWLVILHNAHLMIYDGHRVADILDYATGNLPFWSPAMIEAEIRDRSQNPLYRSYQLAYAAAERMIRELIQKFTSAQKNEFLIGMYTKPMTPRQLRAYAHQMKN